jgi:hypothetical protein
MIERGNFVTQVYLKNINRHTSSADNKCHRSIKNFVYWFLGGVIVSMALFFNVKGEM